MGVGRECITSFVASNALHLVMLKVTCEERVITWDKQVSVHSKSTDTPHFFLSAGEISCYNLHFKHYERNTAQSF